MSGPSGSDDEKQEADAYERARGASPDATASSGLVAREEGDLPEDDLRDLETEDRALGTASDDADPDTETLISDWEAAEQSRPDLPDENEEGLDDLSEEVRHQAEDWPTGGRGDG